MFLQLGELEALEYFVKYNPIDVAFFRLSTAYNLLLALALLFSNSKFEKKV